MPLRKRLAEKAAEEFEKTVGKCCLSEEAQNISVCHFSLTDCYFLHSSVEVRKFVLTEFISSSTNLRRRKHVGF
jgi:hypothetical protein